MTAKERAIRKRLRRALGAGYSRRIRAFYAFLIDGEWAVKKTADVSNLDHAWRDVAEAIRQTARDADIEI